jgi:hypothetical protein
MLNFLLIVIGVLLFLIANKMYGGRLVAWFKALDKGIDRVITACAPVLGIVVAASIMSAVVVGVVWLVSR